MVGMAGGDDFRPAPGTPLKKSKRKIQPMPNRKPGETDTTTGEGSRKTKPTSDRKSEKP